jgi:hypothetical protein
VALISPVATDSLADPEKYWSAEKTRLAEAAKDSPPALMRSVVFLAGGASDRPKPEEPAKPEWKMEEKAKLAFSGELVTASAAELESLFPVPIAVLLLPIDLIDEPLNPASSEGL